MLIKPLFEDLNVLITFCIFPIMMLGIISAGILEWKLHQSISKLPKEWKSHRSMKNFQSGVFFLFLFITGGLVSESISQYLAFNGIYNSFLFSIDFTVNTLFLFGFLYINTNKNWKRLIYFILYAIIVGYLINGEYYDRHCILPSNSSLLIFSLYFIAALLHLTDLLLNPKSTNFNFQLKINLNILFYALISTIVTSFHWAEMMKIGSIRSEFIFYLHATGIYLFYFAFALIFISEILKLRRG